jgi:hypothetical protein
MPKPKDNAAQFELEIAPVLSHVAFPGRRFITIQEFAAPAKLSVQHVLNLIACGELSAVDMRGGGKADGKTPRQWLRIPVAAYDEFIKRRSTL